MLLGRVIGTVVPAVVVDGLEGTPLLWVQPLDREGEPDGEPLVCADGLRMAGPGEIVYWVASREAALTLEPSFVPVDHAIVGLVDDVRLDPVEGEDGIVILAHVVGSVVSTIHHPVIEGRKLLVAERLDAAGRPTGGYLIALDAIGAGYGERVLVLDEGNGARQILGDDAAPVRSIVVAILDADALASS